MRTIIASDLRNTLNTVRRLFEFVNDDERNEVAAELMYAVAKGASNELNFQTAALSKTILRLVTERDNNEQRND
jgi:hypothetical protein